MNVRTPDNVVTQRIFWIDYLRSLNIIATVLFHSFLAYSPFLKQLDQSFRSSFPMLDPITSLRVADFLLLLRPVFSMPLMFYLSGIFVWRGIQKRGSLGYLKNRFIRLIIPLILATIFVMPLTFAPIDLIIHGGFFPTSAKQILLIFLPEDYKLAHLWFLWVLFVFDCIATVVHKLLGGWLEVQLNLLNNQTVYGILTLIILITYIFTADIGGRTGWVNILGPLEIPASKIGLYLIYFLIGVVMGSLTLVNESIKNNIFCVTASNKPSVRVGFCAIVSVVLLVYVQLNKYKFNNIIGFELTAIVFKCLYSFSGFLLVMSLILIAKRFLTLKLDWLDLLNKDSYGIYIIHYVFVAWVQYLLIDRNLPGEYKPMITALFSIPLSWIFANRLRKFAHHLNLLKDVNFGSRI